MKTSENNGDGKQKKESVPQSETLPSCEVLMVHKGNGM
jgi:hypothetical protein